MKWCQVIPILVVLVSTGCGSRDGRLDRADRLACEDPQGALELLDSIDAASLSRSDRARFGLLRGKARDKNHEPGRRDSLLDFAAEYYAGRGDSLEVQALYYRGVRLSDEDSAARAIPTLEVAYRKALANDDHFYAGMAARELGYVFEAQHIVDRQLVWNEKAREEFLKAGKKIHAAWMDLDIADALIYAGRSGEAERILSDLDTEEYANSPHFRKRALRNRLALYSHAGRHDEVIATADSLVGEGMELRPYDYYMLADSYLKKGELTRTNEFRDSLAKNMAQRSDTLCLYYLDSKIARKGNLTPERVEAMCILIEKIMSLDDRAIKKPATLLLADNYSLEATLNRERAESTKQRAKLMWIILTLLVIAGVSGILYLRGRLRIRRLEESRLRECLRSSELRSKSQSEELQELRREITESRIRLEQGCMEMEEISAKRIEAETEMRQAEEDYRRRIKTLEETLCSLQQTHEDQKSGGIELEERISRLITERKELERNRDQQEATYREIISNLTVQLESIEKKTATQRSQYEKKMEQEVANYGERLQEYQEYKAQTEEMCGFLCQEGIHQIEILYRIWKEILQKPGVNRELAGMASKHIAALTSPETLANYTKALDKTNNGWLGKLIEESGEKLGRQEIMLMQYLYLGFKPEMIALLMQKENTKIVSAYKNRLKNKLMAMAPEKAEEFRIYLGIRKC